MECKTFTAMASAYLDGQLTDAETVACDIHLATCADCRLRFEEVEGASLLLKELSSPAAPRELHSYVIHEVASRARHELTFTQFALRWLLRFNLRLVAYSAGSILSALLFAVVFSGFRPIPVPAVEANETALIFPVVSGSDREYHSYNNLPQDKDAVAEEHYYQLPRVLDNSALVSFSADAIVLVSSDGVIQWANPSTIEVLGYQIPQQAEAPMQPAR